MKKILSLFIAAAMVVTMMAKMTVSARAAQDATSAYLDLDSTTTDIKDTKEL